jgi:hypothetical protein
VGRLTPSSTVSTRSASASASSTSKYVLVVSTKDDVQVQVQQVRDRGEHLGCDLIQRRE